MCGGNKFGSPPRGVLNNPNMERSRCFFFGPSGILSWPPTQEFVGGRSHFAADGRDICLRVLERQNSGVGGRKRKRINYSYPPPSLKAAEGPCLKEMG